MSISIEGLKNRAEGLFKPRPIEVTVPSAKWDEVKRLYEDGIGLPGKEKPARAAAIHNILREVGLNIYYDVFLGRDVEGVKEEPYFRVNAGYLATEQERNLGDGMSAHVFSFSRVEPQKAKH